MKHSYFKGIALVAFASGLSCSRDKEELSDPIVEGSPSATPIESTGPTLRGEEIARAVRSELIGDSVVSNSGIRVEFTSGVIELTGHTSDLRSKERAAQLAKTVKGVVAVSNRIEVRPPTVADDQLVAHTNNALVFDPTTESLQVQIEAKQGVVTLNGAVDSWVEKDTAEWVAKGVRGVREVKNQITVDYPTQRPDFEVKRDIESRLRWDALVHEGQIQVSVDDGIANLSGHVGSAAERDRAHRLASWVVGVQAVRDDDLEVRWWAKDEDLRTPNATKPSDQEIQEAIRDAALVDPRVKSYEIRPRVSAGFVTLSGQVDNPRAKAAAESLTRNTVGVIAVKNEIAVAPEQPVSDSVLRDRINTALQIDPATDAYEIDVGVKNGVATLTGKVDSHFERARAQEIAMGLRGVKDLQNQLEVAYPENPFVYDPYLEPYDPMIGVWQWVPKTTSKEDLEIRSAIFREMTWSPFVNSDQVEVKVVGGKATLTGTVDSHSESRAATENAFEGGALIVDNQLKVQN